MKDFAPKGHPVVVASMLIALAILLAACGGAGTSALGNTSWELVALHGADLLPGTTITLRLADPSDGETAVSGSAGCNTYGGGYTASEDRLTFSGVYATEMACMEPQGVMQQEQAYLNALHAAARYQIDAETGPGDQLVLFDEAGTQILVFVAAGA